jgi:DNA topoisomerase-1
MHITLVIVESPAKCKKIESYLGPGYKVIASFGHLRNISGIESIDINNNFNTKYSVIQEDIKLKQIEKLRSEITKSDDIVIATDDDREGESIGWHICELFGLPVTTTKRIIFHEITETAIQSAISQPKRINMNLVQAQQTRQILDLLVGFTISPILWNCVSKTHDTSLSAGRCQTPALRIVYENYLDIKKSPGKLVYNTSGYFTSLNLLFDLNKQFDKDSQVKHFLESCKNWDFIYSTTTPKKIIRKSPEPLTTSSLQQLASNELHMSPKETMKYAQHLYESGYITYMRTDSKKYSQEFIDNVKKFVTNINGDKYISPTINNLIVGIITNTEHLQNPDAEQKGIPHPQEAHEAIRPVNIKVRSSYLKETNVVDGCLQSKTINNVNVARLYELIWKRTLESCMSSAQYNSVSAKISAPLDSEFIYKTEQPIFWGWKIVSQLTKKDEEDDEKHYQFIQTLKQNAIITPKKIISKFNLIELKSHYSEARLVQLLEEKGIGRPSTFASLIDKIQERKYVEKQNITGKEIECVDFVLKDNTISELVSKREFGNEKNKLVIQPLGVVVISFLLEKFEMFFNYEYTKEMEDNLDKIANGSSVWYQLCNNCYKLLMNVTNELQHLKKFSLEIDKNHKLIIGKHGPVVKYTDPNDSKKHSFIPVKKNLDIEMLKLSPQITLNDIIDNVFFEKEPIGKYKGQKLFIKNGKYGIYAQWGKETKSLKEEEGFFKIDEIQYLNVIRYLDKDTVLDPTKPVGLVRELNNYLSIRTGKYGDYIFYKKKCAKKPDFYKLNGFDSDYKKCDKMLLLNWIKQTYKVE